MLSAANKGEVLLAQFNYLLACFPQESEQNMKKIKKLIG